MKQNKISLKRFLFLKICLPIVIIVFVIFLTVTVTSTIYEYKRNIISIKNEIELIANLTEDLKIYKVIDENKFIQRDASIMFRDPFRDYEITLTKNAPVRLDKYDNIFISNRDGIIDEGKYRIFFCESYLSRVCVMVIPKFVLYQSTFRIISICLIGFVCFLLAMIYFFSKLEQKIVASTTRQYIHIKNMLEGKYIKNEKIETISEMDSIRYGLNNLLVILKERREFYNSLIIFQKKLLDKLPVGIVLFNEEGFYEDANTIGYNIITKFYEQQFPTTKNEKEKDEENNLDLYSLKIDSMIKSSGLKKVNEEPVKVELLEFNFPFNTLICEISNKKILIFIPSENSLNPEAGSDFPENSITNFLSNFAHEFRSPLNSVLGFSQILIDGVEGNDLKEIQNDALIINDSAQKLMNFIDDIIFLSRLSDLHIDSISIKFSFSSFLILIDHYFKGIFKDKDTELVINTNITEDQLKVAYFADITNFRRIIILIFLYL
ncbi:MAG TPA: histidine kinase dimerization/phospho-acceptor domain-containing protein, partial [Exilispira sp.]|nr:histidine kinase dimerization/phospho-acceptor domain-containing protein [Exilispira sp.]